jgi:hypothetical protein
MRIPAAISQADQRLAPWSNVGDSRLPKAVSFR